MQIDSRHRISASDLDSLKTRPSLAEAARSLVQAGLTNSAEMRRVLGDFDLEPPINQ